MFKYTKGPYSAKEIEPQIYKYWEDKNLFAPQNHTSSDKVFSITMPPPNITGVLHLGHAMDLSLPDIVCRYKRMNGYSVCWFPGTDQAGLATDNKVEEMVAQARNQINTKLVVKNLLRKHGNGKKNMAI